MLESTTFEATFNVEDCSIHYYAFDIFICELDARSKFRPLVKRTLHETN